GRPDGFETFFLRFGRLATGLALAATSAGLQRHFLDVRDHQLCGFAVALLLAGLALTTGLTAGFRRILGTAATRGGPVATIILGQRRAEGAAGGRAHARGAAP